MSGTITLGSILVKLGIDLGTFQKDVQAAVASTKSAAQSAEKMEQAAEQAGDGMQRAGEKTAEGSKKAERSARDASRAIEQLGQTAGQWGNRMLLGGTGLVAGLMVMAKMSAQTAIEQTRLRRAMDLNGISYEQHRGQVDDLVASLEGLLGVDDGVLMGSMAKLIQGTRDMGKASFLMHQAAGLVANGDMEWGQAVDAMLKIDAGRTREIIQLMPFLKGSDLTAQQIHEAIQQRTAGALSDLDKSDMAGFRRFAQALDTFKKAVGANVLPQLIPYLERLTRWVGDLGKDPEKIKRLTDTLVTLAKTLLLVGGTLKALSWGVAIHKEANTAVTGIKAVIGWLGKLGTAGGQAGGLAAAGLGLLANPITWLVAAIVGLAALFLWKFDDIARGASTLRGKLTDSFKSWFDQLPGWLQGAAKGFQWFFEGIFAWAQPAIKALADLGDKMREAEAAKQAADASSDATVRALLDMARDDNPNTAERDRAREMLRNRGQYLSESNTDIAREELDRMSRLGGGSYIPSSAPDFSPGDFTWNTDTGGSDRDPLADARQRVDTASSWMDLTLSALKAKGIGEDSAAYRSEKTTWTERVVGALQAFAQRASSLAAAATDPDQRHEYEQRSLAAQIQANGMLADIRRAVQGSAEFGLAGGLKVSGLFDMLSGNRAGGLVVQSPSFVFQISGGAGLSQGQMVSAAEQMYQEFTKRLSSEGARRT